MDAYNIGKLAGVLTGFVVGIVLVAVIARFANRNKKMKTEYDERQNVIRGMGYKYGFYAVVLYAALQTILAVAGIELPMAPEVLAFSYIFLGVTVTFVYCVLNDAYWGLNNNRRRYLILMGLIMLLNGAGVARAIADGSLIVDGKLSTMGMNLLVTVMFIIMMAVMGIQTLREKAED
ncbi:MAG: hypothetical protein J5518_10480 [Lachnospiraceae bacterium]|nr:hypothetical protein [Lachnospiraceae bacterium]